MARRPVPSFNPDNVPPGPAVPTLPPYIASLLYLAAAGLALTGIIRGQPWLAKAANTIGALALLVQALVLTPALSNTGHALALTLAEAASLVGIVVAAAALLGAARSRLGGAAVALWFSAAILAAGTAPHGTYPEQVAPGPELVAHIVLSALAAGLLSVAAILVLLLAAQSARLRQRRPLGLLAALPPMETLETAVFRAVLGGFVLLSLSLLSGFLFIQNLFAQHLVHKTVLSIVAWCIFGTLLLGRHRFGWRGRQALRFLLAGYVTLALAYFGSRFVLEGILGRHWG
jgi:ABC-type uncharacterized transport system permease subunit